MNDASAYFEPMDGHVPLVERCEALRPPDGDWPPDIDAALCFERCVDWLEYVGLVKFNDGSWRVSVQGKLLSEDKTKHRALAAACHAVLDDQP